MNQRFCVLLLGEVWDFLDTLDEQTKEKVLYNIDKSKYVIDSELFKKLDNEIWEFRTKYLHQQIRLFSFWDNTENTDTLVVATHGIFKKTDKVSKKEILKAKKIMRLYFEQQKNSYGQVR